MDKNKKCINSAKTQEKRKRLMNEVPNTLWLYQKEQLYDDFYGECALTGKYDYVALDHFVPLNWGSTVRKYGIGGTTYANMVTLHRSINSSKSSMNPFIWFNRYGERHMVEKRRWNEIVEYIAKKHRMTSIEYIHRVNVCYSEVLAKKWITDVNARIEGEEFKHFFYINRALRMNLNISVIVELYGSLKSKEYFFNEKMLDLIKQLKDKYTQ
jgi:5-methylcytosine-specific restriction endonuclease McrA